jgi:transcriptional regulator with XRE-family HTH domain
MTKNKTLTEFRRETNISQSDLARFLRTTPSQIARAAQGVRPLSGKAVGRLEKLISLSLGAVEIPMEEVMTMNDAERIFEQQVKEGVRLRLEKVKWLSFSKKKLLQKLQQEALTLLVLSGNLWNAMKILEAEGAAIQEKNYFKDRIDNAYKKLIACGSASRLKLQIEIDLLTAEASIINQYLGETTVAPGVPM